MRGNQRTLTSKRTTLIITCCLKQAQLSEQWMMSVAFPEQMENLWLSHWTVFFSPSKNTHEAECVTADVVWWEVPKAESLCPLHLLTVLWNSAQLQEGLLGENLVWLQNSNKRNLLRHWVLSSLIILSFHTQDLLFCFEELSWIKNGVKKHHCCLKYILHLWLALEWLGLVACTWGHFWRDILTVSDLLLAATPE